MTMDTLLNRIRELNQQTSRLAAVLRHSVRESIGDKRDHHELHLTEEGRRRAVEFGKNLPRGKTIRLFNSPVSRCRETAECIQEGVQSGGGVAILMGVRGFLRVPLTDFAGALEQMKRIGVFQFTRMWLEDQIDRKIVDAPRQAFEEMATGVVSTLLENEQGHIDLHVAHDWNVLLLRERILGIRHEDAGWPDFLDGVILTHEKGKVTASYGKIAKTIDWS